MKLNIAVLFGAKACEHEISCITATQLMENVDTTKYNVVPIYISRDNNFYTGDNLKNIKNYYDLNEVIKKATKVNFVKENNKVYLESGGFFKKRILIDVALLAIHGGVGEDGSLQGFLEMYDLPYTSSDVLSSAIAQDKINQKILWKHHQIPTIEGYELDTINFKDNIDLYLKLNQKLTYPVILKPNKLGSSIGISVAHNDEEFIDKVNEATNFDFKILVERKLINFKELNCSVLGNLKIAKASVIEEVFKLPGTEFLDSDGKYGSGSKTSKIPTKTGSKSMGMENTSRKVPADLPSDIEELVKKYAVKAFKAINASGVVRIDFMYDQENNQIYLNEINNIPGSMAYYLWEASGLKYSQLVEELIRNALENYRLKAAKTTVFETQILKKYK